MLCRHEEDDLAVLICPHLFLQLWQLESHFLLRYQFGMNLQVLLAFCELLLPEQLVFDGLQTQRLLLKSLVRVLVKM